MRRLRGGFDLVPSNRELAGAEVELVDLPEREMRLKDALAEALSQMRAAISEVVDEYDFILLDCPPSLSLLTLNGLCAADSVLIPMQCEYYALEGLSDLVQTIRKVRAHLNPRLEVEGLLRTMYDPRNTLALNVSADLQKALRRKALSHGHPAQRPSRGSAELRHSGAASRQDVQGRAGLSRAGRRNAAAGRSARSRASARNDAWLSSKGFGRGLDALLSGSDEGAGSESLQSIALDRLVPGKYQPRTRMDDASLDELAESIKAQGVMQPILVRPIDGGATRSSPANDAGAPRSARGSRTFRRWCAAFRIRRRSRLALIENIQREDLNPLEEAQGIARLIDEFKLTHDAAAARSAARAAR